KAVDLQQVTQRRVLELLASDAPLDTVLGAVFDGFVQQWPTARVSLLLVDEAGACLRLVHSANLPDEHRRLLDGLGFAGAVPGWGHRRFERLSEIALEPDANHRWAGLRPSAQGNG